MRLVDKTPPAPTGDTKKDLQNVIAYLNYLQEQLNYIITNINRRIGE